MLFLREHALIKSGRDVSEIRQENFLDRSVSCIHDCSKNFPNAVSRRIYAAFKGIKMVLTPIIKAAKNILIIGHTRPDGDCLGAGLSLKRVCEKLNRTADFVSDSALPAHYSFMEGFDAINTNFTDEYDTVFAVDCGDEARLGKFLPTFKNARVSVNIDHHTSNNSFGKINFVDTEACSVCELLCGMLTAEDIMDKQIAGLLYVGLSTDTGHFMHGNTDVAAFKMATQLIEYGIDALGIVRNIYRSNTVAYTKLVARALNSIRYFEDGAIAIIVITAEDFAACGCTLAETERIIDHAVSIKGVEAAACIAQNSTNGYKVGFRSKNVNIMYAAQVFGGGGHRNAAGCMVFGKLEDVVDKVKKAIVDVM